MAPPVIFIVTSQKDGYKRGDLLNGGIPPHDANEWLVRGPVFSRLVPRRIHKCLPPKITAMVTGIDVILRKIPQVPLETGSGYDPHSHWSTGEED
jgi:hypothetical protein